METTQNQNSSRKRKPEERPELKRLEELVIKELRSTHLDLFDATMSQSSTIFHLGKIINLIPPKKVKEHEIALVRAITGTLFDSFALQEGYIAIRDLKEESQKLKSLWHIKAGLTIQKIFNVQKSRFKNNLYVKAFNHAKFHFFTYLNHSGELK